MLCRSLSFLSLLSLVAACGDDHAPLVRPEDYWDDKDGGTDITDEVDGETGDGDDASSTTSRSDAGSNGVLNPFGSAPVPAASLLAGCDNLSPDAVYIVGGPYGLAPDFFSERSGETLQGLYDVEGAVIPCMMGANVQAISHDGKVIAGRYGNRTAVGIETVQVYEAVQDVPAWASKRAWVMPTMTQANDIPLLTKSDGYNFFRMWSVPDREQVWVLLTSVVDNTPALWWNSTGETSAGPPRGDLLAMGRNGTTLSRSSLRTAGVDVPALLIARDSATVAQTPLPDKASVYLARASDSGFLVVVQGTYDPTDLRVLSLSESGVFGESRGYANPAGIRIIDAESTALRADGVLFIHMWGPVMQPAGRVLRFEPDGITPPVEIAVQSNDKGNSAKPFPFHIISGLITGG